MRFRPVYLREMPRGFPLTVSALLDTSGAAYACERRAGAVLTNTA